MKTFALDSKSMSGRSLALMFSCWPAFSGLNKTYFLHFGALTLQLIFGGAAVLRDGTGWAIEMSCLLTGTPIAFPTDSTMASAGHCPAGRGFLYCHFYF